MYSDNFKKSVFVSSSVNGLMIFDIDYIDILCCRGCGCCNTYWVLLLKAEASMAITITSTITISTKSLIA